jgi:putative hemolysin
MMSSILLEVFLVFFLILLNGFLAMAETALVSSRRTRFQQLADEGDARARAALRLTEDPARFLSTIQAGITLIGIVMGAFAGTTIAETLAAPLRRIPWLAGGAEAAALAVVVIAITFVSIIIGELVPKQISLINPERIALALAGTMRVLASVLSPAVRVLAATSSGILRLFGVRNPGQPLVSEEEIKVMIDQGIERGMFQEAERDMIEGVFDLGDRRVNELMTPRTDVAWLDVTDRRAQILARIRETGHSRYPVCRDGLDTVLGMVMAKDILTCVLADEDADLALRMKPPLYLPEHALALKALETFKKSRQHVALAIDEYGVVQGLITMYDILQAIVGDIPSAGEPAIPMAVQRADGSWLLDGLLPLDRFKELFHLGKLPQEGAYETLGGFLMTQMGRIPVPTDVVQWEGLRLEVVDMDGNRIDKVLAVPAAPDLGSAGHPE